MRLCPSRSAALEVTIGLASVRPNPSCRATPASSYRATTSAGSIRPLIDPADASARATLVERGHRVAEQYLPVNVLPQWRRFLQTVVGEAA